jgi:hypothetical protein
MTGDHINDQINQIMRMYERELNSCPPELAGWQTIKRLKKPNALFVEIVTSFRIDLPVSNGKHLAAKIK